MPKIRPRRLPPRTKFSGRGGQIMILDLLKHNFEKAHELYGDRWPGFAESDLHRWLEEAGFKKIEISVVAREEQPPHFQTILAGGGKSVAARRQTAANHSGSLRWRLSAESRYATIKFTSFFGTTMTFLIVLPAMKRLALSPKPWRRLRARRCRRWPGP